MIKPLLTLFAALFLAVGATSAQTASYDERLLAKFSPEQLERLAQSNPQVIEYWTYVCDKGYIVADVPAGKSPDGLPRLDVKIRKDFNFLALNIAPRDDRSQTFYLPKEKKLLIVKGQPEILKALQAENE